MPTLAQIKDMTDEEVRIALAKHQFGEVRKDASGQPVVYIENYYWQPAPRYPDSLDDLQPIKEGLTPEQKKRFAEALYYLSQCGPFVKYHSDEPAWYSIAIIASAPASIQSRALLVAVKGGV